MTTVQLNGSHTHGGIEYSKDDVLELPDSTATWLCGLQRERLVRDDAGERIETFPVAVTYTGSQEPANKAA